MTSRNRAILALLSERRASYTTIDRIAEETGAGIRTIHRDLEVLERSLRIRGVRLERRRGYGIRLLDPLPEELQSDLFVDTPVVASGQRSIMILIYLIISGDWVKIGSIAGALFVSDSTVSIDLNSLETWLPASLTLERLKGTGVRLIGLESDIRLLFLSVFPPLFPYYVINAGHHGDEGDERLIDALGIREDNEVIRSRIAEAEQILELEFSSTYRGFLFSYFFLISRRLQVLEPLKQLPRYRLDVPEVFTDAAIAVIAGDLPGITSSADSAGAEIGFLARILASCEVARAPASSVDEYLGSLKPGIEAMLEHSLGRLEGKERIWLHDDRKFLNYLRLVVSSASWRIDLGLSAWWEYRLKPVSGIHESPESAVLVSQYLADLGRILGEPDPTVVRRELGEGSLAVAARLEDYRNRGSSGLRVKILCYEGLGMSNYVLALARDAFPAGTVFNAIWDPDFASNTAAGDYDLVISTFPLRATGTQVIAVDGNDPPATIREVLRNAAENLEPAIATDRRVENESGGSGSDAGYSLPDILKIIREFVVADRDPGMPLIEQAARSLDRGDCDIPKLIGDFQRRESYGSLDFEEVGIRVLHCRSAAIPEPRAGVIRDIEDSATYLLLSAPLTADQSQTYGLSEIVIALTEVPEFPTVLRKGSRKELQNVLMSLFAQRNG